MICVGNESVFSDYSAIEPEEDSSAGPDQEGPPVAVRYPRRVCALSLGLPASECEICRGDCPDAERYRGQARKLDTEVDAENQRIADAAVARYLERELAPGNLHASLIELVESLDEAIFTLRAENVLRTGKICNLPPSTGSHRVDAALDRARRAIADASNTALATEAAARHPHCDTCNEHHSDGWCTRWAEYYGDGEMLYCGNHSEVMK